MAASETKLSDISQSWPGMFRVFQSGSQFIGLDYDFVLIIIALQYLFSFAWVKDKSGLRKFRAGQKEDAFST